MNDDEKSPRSRRAFLGVLASGVAAVLLAPAPDSEDSPANHIDGGSVV